MAQVLHKVRPGDTVLSVCLAWGLSHAYFEELNPDFDTMGHRYNSNLVVGERIVVGYTHRVLDHIRIQEKKKQR